MKLNARLTGLVELKELLTALGKKAPDALEAVLSDEADALMRDSQALVPIDTGELAASIYKRFLWSGTRRLQVEVGYGSVYAMSVHENPRSGRTGGFSPSGRPYKHWARVGQWKYLEQPFLARTDGYSERIKEGLFATWLGG